MFKYVFSCALVENNIVFKSFERNTQSVISGVPHNVNVIFALLGSYTAWVDS
jgi:hypothetical protein